jgi:carbon storage regulator
LESDATFHTTHDGAGAPALPAVEEGATMLVLSRQRDESIMIGDNIVVTIVDIRGDKVRLGINAPTEIPVHRQEIYEAIQRENRRAARIEPKDARGLGASAGDGRRPTNDK